MVVKCEVLNAIFSTTPIATSGNAAIGMPCAVPSLRPAAASRRLAHTRAPQRDFGTTCRAPAL
jgi:hypothetical protein